MPRILNCLFGLCVQIEFRIFFFLFAHDNVSQFFPSSDRNISSSDCYLKWQTFSFDANRTELTFQRQGNHSKPRKKRAKQLEENKKAKKKEEKLHNLDVRALCVVHPSLSLASTHKIIELK